jgi:hypothetical protein
VQPRGLMRKIGNNARGAYTMRRRRSSGHWNSLVLPKNTSWHSLGVSTSPREMRRSKLPMSSTQRRASICGSLNALTSCNEKDLGFGKCFQEVCGLRLTCRTADLSRGLKAAAAAPASSSSFFSPIMGPLVNIFQEVGGGGGVV